MLMRYSWARTLSGRVTDKEAEVKEVKRLAARVAQVGKDDPFALCWAGFSLLHVCREQKQAEVLVDKALSLNPNLAASWQVSGSVRVSAGQYEVAIQHLTHALRLNPVGPDMPNIGTTMAVAYIHQGKYDEALHWTNRVLVQSPDNLLGLLTAAVANALAGNLDDARTSAAQLINLNPTWRISTVRETLPIHSGGIDKVVQALRLAGLPE
jgi:tetratricopeptide (TPR) repeat protein